MPGILKIADIEARKRALAQESDVYRESLKLQVQNLTYCLAQTRDKFGGFLGFGGPPASPWMTMLSPLLNSFLKGRGLPGMRIISSTLFAWKLLKKVRFILPFFRRKKKAQRREAAAAV